MASRTAPPPHLPQAQPTRKLVYGHAELHDCLAFADAETAAEEAEEIRVIASAHTWGPPMVTARAIKLLPKDLKDKFAEYEDTVLNGDYLNIPLEREADLVAELRSRGFEVTRDDDLINVLDGRSFNPMSG